MPGAIPILTYLYLSYLLTQLIYARTTERSLSLPQGIKYDQWLCLYYQNPDDGSRINHREVQKNTHIKSKDQCKDKCLKKISIFSCTAMIAKHLT